MTKNQFLITLKKHTGVLNLPGASVDRSVPVCNANLSDLKSLVAFFAATITFTTEITQMHRRTDKRACLNQFETDQASFSALQMF